MCCLNYFNHDRLVENMTVGESFIYHYFFKWIYGQENTPQTLKIDGNVYYYVSVLNKMSYDLPMKEREIRRYVSSLSDVCKDTGLPFIYKYYDTRTRKFFVRFDVETLRFMVDMDYSYLIDKGIEREKNYKGEEMKDKTVKTTSHIDGELYGVVTDVIKESEIFTTRIPKPNSPITKSFEKCCKIVNDIYNGKYVKSHDYGLGNEFERESRNHGFDVSEWRNRILSVKGDWNKVRKLLMDCVENYRLMMKSEYAPISKKNLTKSFDKWLYDECESRLGYNMSLFIQSLNEPPKTSTAFSEMKADRFYLKCPVKVRRGGNRIRKANPSLNSGKLWENLYEMWRWSVALHECDTLNAQNWIYDPDEIVTKFYEYVTERKSTFKDYTCDIALAVSLRRTTMWTNFVAEACTRHGLNSEIVRCSCEKDIKKLFHRK